MLKEQENNDRCGLRISTSEHKKKSETRMHRDVPCPCVNQTLTQTITRNSAPASVNKRL